jgi:hypothetical protein
MTTFFMERAELHEAVAHDIGIGCKALLHLLYGIACDALPVLLMTVDDLKADTIATAQCLCYLDVLLCAAVKGIVSILCRSDAYVEAIGVLTVADKLMKGNG